MENLISVRVHNLSLVSFSHSILKVSIRYWSSMNGECDNCESTSEIAYTLTTHLERSDDQIDLHFCSTDCLQVWT